MIKIDVKIKHSGKRVVGTIEENTSFKSFLRGLLKDGLILSTEPSYIRTVSGYIPAITDCFYQITEKEFVVENGLPPEPPAFRQLGIFLLDGSGSMLEGFVDGTTVAAEAVNSAMQKTIEHFRTSSNKNCFSFSIVAFGDTAQTLLPAKELVAIEDQSYLPTAVFNGGKGSDSTRLASGLQKALELAKDFQKAQKDSVMQRVIIVLLTDGMDHDPDETIRIAGELQNMGGVDICACHLQTNISDDHSKILLQKIAQKYETVFSANNIRLFFIKSASYYARG